jgi:hypothetical protein
MMNRANSDAFKPVAPQLPADIQAKILKPVEKEELKNAPSDDFIKDEVYETGVAEVKPKSGGLFSGLFA